MRSSTGKIILVAIGTVLALLVGVGPFTATAQDASENAAEPIGDVHIRVERDGDALTIIPTYALPDTAAFTVDHRYELTVERTGASTSRSRQSGPFTPTPGRTDTLSTVRLNAQPGDRLHLHLVVRQHDRIVAEIIRTEDVSGPKVGPCVER